MKDKHCGIPRAAAIVSLFLLLAGINVHAQKRITISTTALGTTTQMGRSQSIRIIIEQFSTAEDQKILVDAFARSGNDGIVDALAKMTPKGRISVPASSGNDIKYIREYPSDKGRRFRLVTDRNLAFGEVMNSTRSKDYSLGVIDVTITPDGKGSTGTALPACMLRLNKKKEIEVEANQNPWNLINFLVEIEN